MQVCCVVGARPNFMKIGPVVLELAQRGCRPLLVHTGQHYDASMSQVFFDELGLPKPDLFLNVGSDTHARQTAKVLIAFEDVCREHRPDMVVVGGDVNSTLAAALAAAKLNIPVAHVEAGLRSFDRSMPEEINRMLTDSLSELLFTTEESGNRHLREEGIEESRIHFVGNCMVDSLFTHVNRALAVEPWKPLGLTEHGYALLTLHRPSNVDDPGKLATLLQTLRNSCAGLPLLFPVHPRTRVRIGETTPKQSGSIRFCEPVPYLTFIGLMARARFVLTDSGGVQEETTALGVPCLTLRGNTERPVTIEIGTNQLVDPEKDDLAGIVRAILDDRWKKGCCPPLWDGKAASRIANVLESWAGSGTHTA